jgi:hypothetical protein
MWSWIKRLLGFEARAADSASGGGERPRAPPSPPSLPQLTERLRQIREQMEFYLSDSNVEASAFMKKLVLAREDRYCPLETFLTFNRLKAIDAGEDEIRAACLASAALEVDPTGAFVRTRAPFRPDPRRDFRSIHVEQLARDETLESLQALFRDAFGTVLRVDMRYITVKGGERAFAGSANVELETEAAAQRAIEEGLPYRGEVKEIVLLSDFKAGLQSGAPPPPPAGAGEGELPRRGGKKKTGSGGGGQ